MKKFALIFLTLCICLTGCQTPQNATPKKTSQFESKIETLNGLEYHTTISEPGTLQITKKVPSANFGTESLDTFPTLEASGGIEIDVRHMDLSKAQLENRLSDLMVTTFDDGTQWPSTLPKVFDLEKIKAYGMDPGLGIRALHKAGITGKSVGVAIIDQGLLVDHVEYKGQLRLYEEIHCSDDVAQMHGAAVASIAVGKNVGVAPGADLYYIGETHCTKENDRLIWDYSYIAQSIERLLEINAQLPADKKIRVLSISLGFNPYTKGYAEVMAALTKAANENIYPIYVESNNLLGIGRNPLKDPNDITAYQKGLFWKNASLNDYASLKSYLAPMDSRCIASPTGEKDYVYYANGGMSWSIPYLAGLYALACEVKPALTPAEFEQTLLSTRTPIQLGEKEFTYLINPTGIIDALKEPK